MTAASPLGAWPRYARRIGAFCLLAALLQCAVPSASAEPVSTFSGLASAAGIEVTIANGSIPLFQPQVEASGPTSQAKLDSLGSSVAFSSFPYPGETGATVTGVLSGVFGVPLPAYPLYVTTASPPESKEGGAPGISLSADSQTQQATASALVGAGTTGGASRAQVVGPAVDGAGLAARAGSSYTGIDVGGVFSIRGAASTASAVYGADGKLALASSLRISDISVPGLKVTLPASTPTSVPIPVPIPGIPQLPPITLPGVPLPAPFGGATLDAPHLGFEDGYFTTTLPFLGSQKYLVPASSVLPALASAGVQVTYQAATPIRQGTQVVGVIAPNLTFSTTLPAPPSNPGVNGPTTINLQLTRALASISGIASAPGIVGTLPGNPNLGGIDTVSGSVDDGFTSGTGSGVAPAPGLGLSASEGTGTDRGPTLAGNSGAATGAPPFTALVGSVVPLSRESLDIYLVLVAVAVIGLSVVGTGTLRVQGVRKLWNS